MSGRTGKELTKAIEDGDELTEVERLRVVIAMKDAQIDRLVAAQESEGQGA